MDKYVFDNSNGLWYELNGGYYIPCLILPAEEEKATGIYGQRHLRYLKEHHRVTYANLLTSGRLNAYLAEIDEQAKGMFFWLVKEYADRQGVTEQLKADDQIAWVCRMNSIRNRATEIVNSEIIYI